MADERHNPDSTPLLNDAKGNPITPDVEARSLKVVSITGKQGPQGLCYAADGRPLTVPLTITGPELRAYVGPGRFRLLQLDEARQEVDDAEAAVCTIPDAPPAEPATPPAVPINDKLVEALIASNKTLRENNESMADTIKSAFDRLVTTQIPERSTIALSVPDAETGSEEQDKAIGHLVESAKPALGMLFMALAKYAVTKAETAAAAAAPAATGAAVNG